MPKRFVSTKTSFCHFDTYKPEYIEPNEYNDDGDEYRFRHPIAIILNIDLGYPCNKDTEALKETFIKLGYTVQLHDIENIETIDHILDDVPTAYDCVAVILLASRKLKTDAFRYGSIISRIQERFPNKPKIFIFQVCSSSGTTFFKQLPKDTFVIVNSEHLVKNENYVGTWFIQVFCKRLNIITKRNTIVDEMIHIQRDYSNTISEINVPVVAFNMSKDFYLYHKESIGASTSKILPRD